MKIWIFSRTILEKLYTQKIIYSLILPLYSMIIVKTCYPNTPRTCKKFIQGIIWWKLGVCVQRINNVKSYFFWEGKIQSSSELILLIKTSPEKKEKLVSYIQKNHPYDIPEISTIETSQENEKYQKWANGIL